MHTHTSKIGIGILIILLFCLLIAPVSAAVGDTILFEQVNISKNITLGTPPATYTAALNISGSYEVA